METMEELRMVPLAANQNTGNVVNLEDYRDPLEIRTLDTRAMEFFETLADEFLGKNVLLITTIVMYKDENNILRIKDYKLD